ncbi:hypothetical protein BST92_05270 [Nonlabens arenilitoris]|uniref:Uncharacterized protein n=1 Tax=Nonlabens arenilitoris TaxID=1217969 RepID=A0A2S7U8W1_9FLAO|nr:hypothetical protein [Nonlabens arenilitoris]PQJ31368.1 hypothetical protein BST92_05270 [Nonlabens arenilitoris]
MKWFVHRKGYLVVLGLLAISPIIFLILSSLVCNSWKILNVVDDTIAISILIGQIIIGIICFALSLFELRKNKTEYLTNKIVGTVLGASILLPYLTIFILIATIIN